METIWMIPLHIIPVVSFDGLLKGELTTPTSGLDRFNLTDIGLEVYNTFIKNGAEVKFKGVQNPFPWEMVFKIDKDPKASLRGITVGASTFRSIFKLMFYMDDDVVDTVRTIMDGLDRDPLGSKYWMTETWKDLQGINRMTKDQVIKSNRKVLSLL